MPTAKHPSELQPNVRTLVCRLLPWIICGHKREKKNLRAQSSASRLCWGWTTVELFLLIHFWNSTGSSHASRLSIELTFIKIIVYVPSPFPLPSFILQYPKMQAEGLVYFIKWELSSLPRYMQVFWTWFCGRLLPNLSKGLSPQHPQSGSYIATTRCSGLSTCTCAWNPPLGTQVDIGVIYTIKWNPSTFCDQKRTVGMDREHEAIFLPTHLSGLNVITSYNNI